MKRMHFIIILCVLVGAYVGYCAYSMDAFRLRGSVVGDNPDGIPRSDLPSCGFNGQDWSHLPCYAPPGVVYE